MITIQSRLPARLAVAGLLSCFLACGRKPSAVVGGLYAVSDGGGAHRVVKVVAVDNAGVHVRLFKNAWKERPAKVDPASLTLGSILDADGFGLAHLAVAERDFEASKPSFLSRETLNPDELAAYAKWKGGRKRRSAVRAAVQAAGGFLAQLPPWHKMERERRRGAPAAAAAFAAAKAAGKIKLWNVTKDWTFQWTAISAFPWAYDKIPVEENNDVYWIFHYYESGKEIVFKKRRVEFYYTGGDWMQYGNTYFVTNAEGPNAYSDNPRAYLISDLSTPDKENGAVAPKVDPFDTPKLEDYILNSFLDEDGKVRPEFQPLGAG